MTDRPRPQQTVANRFPSSPLGVWRCAALIGWLAFSSSCASPPSDIRQRLLDSLRTEEKTDKPADPAVKPSAEGGGASVKPGEAKSPAPMEAATRDTQDVKPSDMKSPAPTEAATRETQDVKPGADSRPGKPTTIAIRSSSDSPGNADTSSTAASTDTSVLRTGADLPADGPAIGPPPTSPADVPRKDAGPELAIDEVLQFTLQNHPILRLRQHEIQAARGKLITAGLLPNPRWVIEADSPLRNNDDPQLMSRIEFVIPTGPKRRLRTAEAQAGVRQSQFALGRETKLVLAESMDAALEVVYLQDVLSLQRELASLAEQAAQIAKERFNIGAMPYRSVVLADLTAKNMELALRATTASQDRAQVRLARAMGNVPSAPRRVRGQLAVEPLPAVPLAAVLDRAGKVAPELAEAQAAIQKSQERVELERWLAVPDVSVGPTSQERLSNSNNHSVGARLTTDFPLFDRNQGNIAERAALVEANRAQLRITTITTLGDVATAYQDLKDVQSRWDYYSRNAQPLMQESETALRLALKDQTVPVYELVDLLQQFGRMRLTDLDLRYQHQRLRARLELLLECRLLNLAAEPIPASPPAGPVSSRIGLQPVRR